jgi:hypothetical protein
MGRENKSHKALDTLSSIPSGEYPSLALGDGIEGCGGLPPIRRWALNLEIDMGMTGFHVLFKAIPPGV